MTGDLHASPTARAARGRPPSTTHVRIEQSALHLFAREGFEAVTVDDIAAAVGVGRRTVFRYFPTKNDIVWGDFDSVVSRLRTQLRKGALDAPLREVLARAVIVSNRYDADQLPQLRIRLTLITSVPALQAHSMLRYATWRAVVAEWASERLGSSPEDLEPQVIAQVALGTAMAAFVHWAANPEDDLEHDLARGFDLWLARGS